MCFLGSPRSLTAPRFCSDSYDGMGLALQYHCLSLFPNFPWKPYLKTNNNLSQTLSINRNNVHIKNRILPSIMSFYYLSVIDSFFISLMISTWRYHGNELDVVAMNESNIDSCSLSYNRFVHDIRGRLFK